MLLSRFASIILSSKLKGIVFVDYGNEICCLRKYNKMNEVWLTQENRGELLFVENIV